MIYLIAGLGNPGEEYKNTRHNVGRTIVEIFRMKNEFPEWEFSKNANALYSKKKIGKHEIELILPETFMNKSGKSIKYAKTKHKIKSENIIVVHDDIDLPLGVLRILFARGSGGHRGVESVKRAVGTKDFTRLRFGVASTAPSGKIKKLNKNKHGEQKIIDFVLKKFSKKERGVVDVEVVRAVDALGVLIKDSREQAMNKFNK